MRAIAFLATCLLPFSSLDAEDSRSKPVSEWAITGTVVDEAGDPVEGAAISLLYPRDLDPIQTNADGRFRFPLPETAYRDRLGETLYFEVHASKDNLLGIETRSAKLGEIEPMTITVKPAREITVRVTDGDGEPVEGADVMTVNFHTLVDSGRTDAEGKWTGWSSPQAGQWAVVAFKADVGFNYVQSSRWPSIDNRPAKPLPDHVSLQLNGPHSLRVKVVDRHGEALAGVTVVPWLIRTAGHDDSVNLSGLSATVVETDSKGLAAFDWLPKNNTSISIIADADQRYTLNRDTRLRDIDSTEEITITMLPKETLSGRVTDADDKPVAGIVIHARGQGGGSNRGFGSTITDADGRYELNLHAEQAYLVRVVDDEWAAPWEAPVVLHAGEPVTEVDFSLEPATKLHGRVTAGKEDEPVRDAHISLNIKAGAFSEILQFVPADGYPSDKISDALYTRTDEDGYYEFHLGPGGYSMRKPGDSHPVRDEPIEIAIPSKDPPAQIEKNIHLDRPLTGSLTVTVVDQEGIPIPDAVLSGEYQGHTSQGWTRPVIANGNGVAKTERGMERLVIQGASPDGKLIGITRLDADAAIAKVVLGSASNAAGILVDESGEPIANEEISYAIPIHWKSGPRGTTYSWIFGGHATTNGNGRFTITGLIPHETYAIRLPVDDRGWRTVTTVIVPAVNTIDLGTIAANSDIPPE